jgi:large subunit ribosomal protein L19
MIKIDNIKPGNTVRVWQKIKEGEKTRLQAFEGLVISHKHGQEPGATFIVRRVIEGIGVERIFPLFSPNIEKVDLVKRAQARRAKLYYVREKAAREISKKMKQLKTAQVMEPADMQA